MRIGVPTELKPLEGRVGLIPAACASLIHEGHDVYVEADAGKKSGYGDDQYRAVGVNVVSGAAEIFERCVGVGLGEAALGGCDWNASSGERQLQLPEIVEVHVTVPVVV